jgi:hypothetical protein
MNLQNIILPEENVMAGLDLNVYIRLKDSFRESNDTVRLFEAHPLHHGANLPSSFNNSGTIRAIVNEFIFKKRE